MIENQDLEELRDTQLSSVNVGLGSITIQFGTGAHILIQCPFEVYGIDAQQLGNGELPESAALLFKFLNKKVSFVELDKMLSLRLDFEGGLRLRIVPIQDGLEAYVLTTRYGVCPVICF